MKHYQKNNGFTLIELLVVVLIIGILSAIALPQYTKAVERARAAEAFTNLRALVQAEKVYKMANGTATRDLTLLDIQLAGEFKDNELALPLFTYKIVNIDKGSEGFEAVATRNDAGNNRLKYYLYYYYNGGYRCVATHQDAKDICNAICGAKATTSDQGYACIIR